MKIYVVGSSKNNFLPLDNIREKFLIDIPHEGDNIDFLNPWYCELTGLYYLWKHVDDDVIGLEHYRTYFWKNDRPINEIEINNLLNDYDIICSGYKYPAWGYNTLRPVLELHSNNNLKIFMDVLKNCDKDFYAYFNNYLDKQYLWCCNTFIGAKKIIDEWLNFFFNVIVEFEKVSPIGPQTNTLRREGYFAEFMFGAWLEYKKYKIICCEMHKFDKDLNKLEFIFNGEKL